MTELFGVIFLVLVASLFSVSAPPAEAEPSCLRTSRRFIAAAQTNKLTHSCLFIQPPSPFLLLLSLSCLRCFHLPVFQLKVKETTATHSDVCSTSRPLAIKASMHPYIRKSQLNLINPLLTSSFQRQWTFHPRCANHGPSWSAGELTHSTCQQEECLKKIFTIRVCSHRVINHTWSI